MKTRKIGFTLIELLVVIGIIGILVSILLPAVIGAIQSGEKGKARTEVKGIKAALDLYYEDYRHYPLVTSASDKSWTSGNKDIIEVLRGLNTAENPRKRTYLDVPDASILNATNSATYAGSMADPWDQPYRIAVDGSGDNTVVPAGPGRSVAVWSCGPDTVDNNGGNDDIKSW